MPETGSQPCWICPVCARPLVHGGPVYRCAEGHSFDVAREGYVNLLLARHKKSVSPGDDKAMVAARRAFLEAGHYAAFSQRLNRLLGGALTPDDEVHVLEVGCGEGYYLRRLAEHWQARHPRTALGVWGLDISRPAVRLAAKGMPAAHWAVASSYRIPIADHSLHAVLRLFAPGDAAEFRRVLRPGGWLLIATPGPRHLLGLKSLLYGEPRLHQEQASAPAGFERREQLRLEETLRLRSKADINNLFRMTPFYWNVDQATQARLLDLETLETDIDFILNLYQKV